MALKPPARALLAKIFDNNHEMIKTFENLFVEDTNVENKLAAIQLEIDRIETGAGLNTDGTYIQPSGTNYLDGSTSIAEATILLDNATSGSSFVVKTKTQNYQALNESQMILVDAFFNTIDITLPNPSLFHSNNTSKTIGITKIDTSKNRVTILPFNTELIANNPSQYLSKNNDVLNFITDGTNWYLNN